jgi:4-amino-4-deoxy-L-arabinose transferase-like glycosyltransferase
MQPVTQPHKSPSSRLTLLAAVLLLGFLFATNVYRAATQSIVHDEALTYQFYLSRPSSFLFTFYDANHHFLSTLLMKLSTSLFGYSELSMRLTSLAAGGLYFYTVYQLCLLLFGDGLFFLSPGLRCRWQSWQI